MPRSTAAKQWQPDTFEQDMIDKITAYAVVAERSAAHLRSFHFPDVERLWARVQADFQGDAVKYPSVMADGNDEEGRERFRVKCRVMCFPLKPPSRPEECVPSLLTASALFTYSAMWCPSYILMIFAANAALQSLTTQDLDMHPYEGEINYRANLQVWVHIRHPSACAFCRKAAYSNLCSESDSKPWATRRDMKQLLNSTATCVINLLTSSTRPFFAGTEGRGRWGGHCCGLW